MQIIQNFPKRYGANILKNSAENITEKSNPPFYQ